MAHEGSTEYAVKGNRLTEQAEASTANRGAGTTEMRILIELQVLTMLIHEMSGSSDDLTQLRQDVADSIT